VAVGAADPVGQLFATAGSRPDLVVLEGFHALKHALRFGAELLAVAAADRAAATALAEALAPELAERLAQLVTERPLAGLVARVPHTGVVAVARRPPFALPRGATPLVLLEDPRQLGNVGAVVRVAAAAGAGAVLTTGAADPWHPAALRGSAGLHFALPVGRIDPMALAAPLVAVVPGGEPLGTAAVPAGAVLAFGTERAGLSRALEARAGARIGIPMRAGVSSLNVATAVAVILYAAPGLSAFSQRSIVQAGRSPTDS
jgi:RNA methyltransferase, TrmH family